MSLARVDIHVRRSYIVKQHYSKIREKNSKVQYLHSLAHSTLTYRATSDSMQTICLFIMQLNCDKHLYAQSRV